MLRRTEGIVLRTFPYGEADLIATFLTPDFGLLKVFVKSPRKIKSRFGSSLEPLTCSRISFWGKEDAALPRLTQCDIVHTFQEIRNNLRAFLRVSEIIELTLAVSPEKDANKSMYLLLSKTLQAVAAMLESACATSSARAGSCKDSQHVLEVHGALDLLMNHFKVKMLKHAGFAPKFDSCGRCGEKGVSFYVSQGSVLCISCAKGCDASVEITPAVRKLYEDLVMWDTEKIRRIKPSPGILENLSRIINYHIQYIIEKPLNTEAFLCAARWA